MWCKQLITVSMAAVALLLPGLSLATVTASNFSVTPPNITESADPFVMISLSVELTQQAEAYTDGEQTYVGGTFCPGRVSSTGICYSSDEVYLGYFDSRKCYVYDTSGDNSGNVQLATGPQTGVSPDHFRPVGYANDDYECSGSQFSGNFMNWATMTALDEFRYAMTGGARLVDTAGENAKTLLTRTHRYGDWSFVSKKISSATSGSNWLVKDGHEFVNDVSKLTPFSETIIRVDNGGNYGNRVRFYDNSGNQLGEYNVIVEVCNASIGVEDNCVKYTDGSDTWYKPEGVMQKHALEMRFALTSYSGHDSNKRNGGILRANAKYIGYRRPADRGGLELNLNAEINEHGQYVDNPDKVTTGSGVHNSGILNYINSFGLGPERYKSFDPVAELYYEGLRYIKNLGPTPEYYGAASEGGDSISALTDNQKDNFPVVTVWDDPVLDACQKNYMIAIGDQFAWGDNSLPGATVSGSGVPSAPSNPDNDYNVDTLTDTVGTLEGFHAGSLGSQTRGRDNNGWYLAGLTYYANTEDIRDDLDGKQTVKTFVVDTQEYNSNPPTRQENPLWLAAKYGGFDDLNGDKNPNNGTPGASTAEWDRDEDNEPDTYTLASQPANLIKGLNNAFNVISERISSGSAASVVTSFSTGGGAVYQGLYKPALTKGNDRVEWLGIVHALFIDDHGNFREDKHDAITKKGDGKLTDTDPVVRFVYDAAKKKTLVQRYITTDGGETVTTSTPVESDVEIEDLDTIWNARDKLSELTNLTTQREYTDSAEDGRYIFTAIDSNADGIVELSDKVDFDNIHFPSGDDGTSNNFRYLGLTSENGDEAPNIVDFIRGKEGIAGYRSRTIDYENDNEDVRKVWRLGDIIHSSPVTVSRPEDRYDLIYDDDTYEAFREKYFDRRHVVYAGANDGMLHAFNAGFYITFDPTTNSATREFRTAPVDGSVTEHPLGSELWAYVPYNVLPHLRWLTELDYPHVYYVDGIPQAFDVNIFTDDTDPETGTHPNGWGTILVVGLRFGGGDITFDPNSDSDGDTSDDITTRSSYIVLDITDPEQEPKLVAEITHPEMGYATTRPALVKNRRPDEDGSFNTPEENSWYLVFGSGPAGTDEESKKLALTNGISNQNAKVFVFNLNTKSFVAAGQDSSFDVTGATDGFVGDLTAVDWNGDYVDDVVYFGTVRGTVDAPTGEMMRFRPGSDFNLAAPNINKLIDKTNGVNQPFSGKPLVRTDSSTGNHWVYIGTGRFYVEGDNLSSGQQSYYGIKEPVDSSGALDYSIVDIADDLINTTGIDVLTDGSLKDSEGNTTVTLSNNASADSFTKLRTEIRKESGWFLNFDDIKARQVGRSGRLGDVILFTEYVPTGDACNPLGETFLNAVHFEGGAAAPFAALDEDGTYISGPSGDAVVAERSVSHGVGLVRDVNVSGESDGHGRAIGQDSTGGLTTRKIWREVKKTRGRMSWRELDIDW